MSTSVTRRPVWVILIALLALGALPTASHSQGNSEAAHDCQDGGYQEWVTAEGDPFRNTGDCVSYVARGGELTHPNRTYPQFDCSAIFPGADLSACDLYGFNFYGADLSGVNFTAANLIDANLSGANLSGANLTLANMTGANLNGAILYGVYWSFTVCPNGTISTFNTPDVCTAHR